MDSIQKAVEALIAKHGGLRAAARATRLDHGYLCRLRKGHKDNPSRSVLAALGLQREVTYRQKPPRQKKLNRDPATEVTPMA